MSQIDYTIQADTVPLTLDKHISLGEVVIIHNKEEQLYLHCKVDVIGNDYLIVRKMASHGIPVKLNERTEIKITIETFKSNRLYFIDDKTNDRSLWPETMQDAVSKLKLKYSERELTLIKSMKWEQFDETYNSFGGLSMWIRNYFGLHRGNYDLALDCGIEEPNADDVSSIIVYNLWEHIKDLG